MSAAKPPAKPVGRTCPLCGKPTDEGYRPFCSKRCADLDLARWLNGSYAIPGEPAEEGDPPPRPAEEPEG